MPLAFKTAELVSVVLAISCKVTAPVSMPLLMAVKAACIVE